MESNWYDYIIRYDLFTVKGKFYNVSGIHADDQKIWGQPLDDSSVHAELSFPFSAVEDVYKKIK